jgi:hypothetical protein
VKIVNLIKTEPALFLGIFQAVLALLSGTVLTWTAAETGAALAANSAALALIGAVATRPFQVSALTGFVAAIVTLLVSFGVPHVDPGIVATLNATIVAVAALIVRLHVTPVASLLKPAKPSPTAPSPVQRM